MSYDDTARAELAAEVSELLGDLQDDGVIFAELEVALITETRTGANPARGQPGTAIASTRVLDPRPRVDLRAQIRTVDGIATRVGDGLLKIPRGGRAGQPGVTMADLLGAAYLTIAGERYTFADGWLKQTPLFWIVVVKRART